MRLNSKNSGSVRSSRSSNLRPSKMLFNFLKRSFVDVERLVGLFQGLKEMNLIPKRRRIKLKNLGTNKEKQQSPLQRDNKSHHQNS